MRKILFSLVLLLALLLAAEVGVTLLSQHGMERALRSQYDLPTSLESSINSFPFLVSLARNHMSEVRLSWSGDLQYQAGEGAVENLVYLGSVVLYDVELNVSSLLKGKLEIRHVSRQKAAISIDAEGLGRACGLRQGALFIANDMIFVEIDGEKTQYKVKVSGDHSLTLEPYGASSVGTGLGSNPYAEVKTIVFDALPLGATLLNASVNRDRVQIEMSIPMWEGYL
ncbi:MAG: DUF2993 domain-containing protein [Actinomycetota bacterium]|nr:DUF2993 domain-containing protein [Actinomycetota bacterium]MDD5667317.1 DUF2993 domain-containing protein [Actinomycetota bacterium]